MTHKTLTPLRFLGLICFSLIMIPASVQAQEMTTPHNTVPASFADLAEDLIPSVVNVSSSQKIEHTETELPEFPTFPEGSPFEDFFEEFMDRRGHHGGPSLPAASLGSGFIIDAEKGYIITNNHVIRDADKVRVTLHDDSTLEAKIIGRDEKVDIAVLQVDTKKKLTAVEFGDSATMRVGDWILAIGNPFGLGGTVTSGIISARQRDIQSGPYDDYIQTDASINRGNSGGPMFNLDGEVIGINTAIFSPSGGSVGIGFAIPSNLAKPLIDQIIEFGRTRRGWLGVRIQTVTDEIAESLGLDEPRGALVATVTEDGPAEKSDLRSGDIIVSFDGKDIATMRELPRVVAETSVDKKVVVEYWRDGKIRKTRVKVGELEKAEESGLLDANTSQDDDDIKENDDIEKVNSLGLFIAPLTKQYFELYGLDDDAEGVIITEIAPSSIAEQEGLREGDIIVEINQESVDDVSDVKEQVHKAQKIGRSSVLLLLNRDGDMRFIALKLGDD